MEPAPQPAEQQLADQLYDIVRRSIDTKRITVASVLNIVTIVMVEVERLGVATGPQKKELALHVIARLIDEIPADQEDKAAIKNAVALLGPSIIDTIVAASKGQITINIPGLAADGKCCGKACCTIC
jgi:hypothetical protein